MCYVESRNNIERIIIKNIIIDKNTKIFELYRNEKGEVLAYSPYQLAEKTNQEVPLRVRYQYNNLSKKIHFDEFSSERTKLERKIDKMLQNSSGLLTFEWYNLILNTTHEQIVKYCKNKKIKILSKDEFNHIKNMIKKMEKMKAKRYIIK